MTTVSKYNAGNLNMDQAKRAAILIKMVWPDSSKSVEEFRRSFMEDPREGLRRTFHIIWKNDQAIAFAQTFSRNIKCEESEMEVMALAGVCVNPNYRGRGLGTKILGNAFGEIHEGRYSVSLFQTDIPDFYRRWGAITIENEFWDSTGVDPCRSPWWNDYVMIYPGSFKWPTGKIDLNGPGY